MNARQTENRHLMIIDKNVRLSLDTLISQRINLSKAIDQLLENISKGSVIISTYKQMKMYNDESLNPELYSKDD